MSEIPKDMKRFRSDVPSNFEEFHYQVPKSYIRNYNTVTELQALCDFYEIDYNADLWEKDDYVQELRKVGKKFKLRKIDLRYNANKHDIKLTDTWLEIALDVVKKNITSFAMNKKEIFRLIYAEIERRHDKGELSDYKYNKCHFSYRTFMRYVGDEYDYEYMDEKTQEMLLELEDWIKIAETEQKNELFKKMVADDTKGRQRFRELISTKDDNWNRTKKVDKKLDGQVAMEQMMSEIASEGDDLTSNDVDGQEETGDSQEKA